MSRPVAILRPAPANDVTAQRVRDAGLTPLQLPLFAVGPMPWEAPDPAEFDGILLTSANAVRHGGPQLAAFKHLPLISVGPETARVALADGWTPHITGDSDLKTLLSENPQLQRLLWLSGRERTAIEHPAIQQAVAVYASDTREVSAEDVAALQGAVVLIHSARAFRTLAALVDQHHIPRASIKVAAISAHAAQAGGDGWDEIGVATAPNDPALIAAARALAIDPWTHRENKVAMTPETSVPAPHAPQRTSQLTTVLVSALVAFLAGLAAMAIFLQMHDRNVIAPSADDVPAAPAPAPVMAAPNTDIATLAAREQALAARLDALDARMQATDNDARIAASYAGRAEAMMLVFSARRALERGQELGVFADELKRRMGSVEPDAVATVLSTAAEPVTVEDLRQAFEQIAPRLSTTEPDASFWSQAQRELSSLVIIRKQGSPSPHPRERLARARRLLSQGHVEAALAEVSRLPGAQGAESWMAAASRLIATRRALDTLERSAIRGKVLPAAGSRPPQPTNEQINTTQLGV